MPDGGKLTITGENTILSADAVSDVAGDFVRLSIADTGTGIDPAILSRVFEPFFTTKEMGKGSGLGLSQVYGFAAQSGGRVTVESQPRQGTMIRLFLPRAAEHASATPPDETAAAPLDKTVLMVEDDDDVAFAAASLIEDIGFIVYRVSGPKEALERLKSGKVQFGVVFSDIVMPGPMNGIDFAREVRQLYPGLPLVLTTGHSQAAASAATEFMILPKPYTRVQLTTVLSNA